jgi:tRNA 2-thiouridine synthesizing protein D
MNYVLHINSSPFAGNAGLCAYRFACTAIAAGHRVTQIFFSGEGVYHAWRKISPADDEFNLNRAWSQLAQQHRIDLSVCISAAQRRGLLSAEEAQSQNFLDNDWADGFRAAGLSQWLDASIRADRCLQFGW